MNRLRSGAALLWAMFQFQEPIQELDRFFVRWALLPVSRTESTGMSAHLTTLYLDRFQVAPLASAAIIRLTAGPAEELPEFWSGVDCRNRTTLAESSPPVATWHLSDASHV